jgi:hypothetical protein
VISGIRYLHKPGAVSEKEGVRLAGREATNQ